MHTPLINIAIPTFNRAFCIGKAVEHALAQSYHRFTVTVIDDGSTDDTARALRPYLDDPRVCYVRLAENVGTAQAKNVALLVSRYDAITFHDSDDLPSPHKLLLQARALTQSGHRASPVLDWAAVGVEPGAALDVDVVVGAHDFVKLDGSVHRIDRRISLVDDFFPHLQFPARTEGDWVLINSGLFRRRVFEEVGGYEDSVEEDRELRNRTIAAGYVYFFVEEPLLTKVEMVASLTTDDETGYAGAERRRDRAAVWERKRRYLRDGFGAAVRRDPARIDCTVGLAEVSNPALLTLNDLPMTPATREAFTASLRRHGVALDAAFPTAA